MEARGLVGEKAVLYARVSSKEQEQGFSIPAQRDLLREYAQKQGIKILREFVEAETAKQAGRSAFGEMVGFLIENPSARILLVEKTDRLYRNFHDYATLDNLIQKGLAIHLVKEGEILSETSRSHQKFIHGIKVLMAKNYIDNLSEEVRKGHSEKAEQGEYPSIAPIGYRNNLTTHTIEVNEPEAEAIRRLFNLYATGNYSIKQLREVAIEAGVVGRRSGRHLSHSQVQRILTNPIYYGAFRWKERLYPHGKHRPIITKELFDLVQQKLEERHRATRGSRLSFAFSGIFSCGYCGCSLTAERHKGRYVYYRCTHSRGQCPQPYLRECDLEEMATSLVKRVQLNQEDLDLLREVLQTSHSEEQAFHDGRISALEAQEKAFQRRLDQIYLDKLDGQITEEFWHQKTDEWRAEQDEVRRKLALHQKANRNYLDEGVKILELAQQATAVYVRATATHKRNILRALLSNCSVKDTTPDPAYRKPFCWLAELKKSEEIRGRRDLNPRSSD